MPAGEFVASPPNDPNNAVAIAAPLPVGAIKKTTEKAERPQRRNVELYTQVLRARAALEVAHRALATHRTTYDTEFAKYRASHPNEPTIDLRDAFGQRWFQRGCAATRKIAAAEMSLQDAMREAAAAGVSIRDPQDDGENPGFYDDDDLIDMLVTTVDWTGVEVGADPDVQPVEADEKNLERMALEGGSSIARLTRDSRVGNVFRGLRRTLWSWIVKTMRFSKRYEHMGERDRRRAHMSISERAYGRRRERIEKWVLGARGGQHQKF
jgi:hypothetical protein